MPLNLKSQHRHLQVGKKIHKTQQNIFPTTHNLTRIIVSYVSDNKEAVIMIIDKNTPMVDDALKELDEVRDITHSGAVL